jgi:hypothetical protein
MKNIFSHYLPFIILIVIWVILIFVGPLIINCLFISSGDNVTKWGPGDLLSYYGGILGAAATIFALILTIRYTNKDNKKQLQRQIKLLKADLEKEELIRKYEDYLNELLNIKKLLLLKDFEDLPLFDMENKSIVFSKHLMDDIEKIVKIISKENLSVQETAFFKVVGDMLNKYEEEYQKFKNSIAENSELIDENKAYRKEHPSISIPDKNTPKEPPTPRYLKEIVSDYTTSLYSIKKAYQNQFDTTYDPLIIYLESKLSSSKEKIYDEIN